MSKPNIGWRRAGLASLATSTLVMGACFAGAGAASADAGFAFERVGGDNRYETAVDVSDKFGDTSNVIIANGEQGHFPDALVANYLAGVQGAPVLLTKSDKMPQDTMTELSGNTAAAKTATIVGGEDVVSADQAQWLEDQGYTVKRIAGQNRYDTAAAVINEAGDAASTTAIITTGVDFPDALAGGPLAFHEGMPMAISRVGDIRDSEVDALVDSGVSKFVVLGGAAVVGQDVIDELEDAGLTFDLRLAGEDRAETSVEVAEYALDTLNFDDEHVNVASGYIAGTGADALAGGPLTGEQVRPLLITKSNKVAGDSVLGFLEDHANTLQDGLIFGLEGAVSQGVEDAMEEAAQAVTTNQSYRATPNDATTANTAAGGTTKVTISGIDANQVNLTLIDCDQASTDQDGKVSFADSGNDDKADLGAAKNATITEVNGVQSNYGTGVNNVDVHNGEVTVTVTSSSAGCSQLVAFQDKDNNGALTLDGNNMPTDPFGITGEITAVTPTKVAFANPTPTTPYGSYTSTAQLEDGNGDAVTLAGVPVKFSRTLPDGSVQVSTVNTNAKGEASITFSASDPSANANDTTKETVVATPDLNQDGDFADTNEATGSATQTVTFSDQAPAPSDVALTSPAADSYQAIGTAVTVTAKVTDQYGNAVSGQAVHFSTTTGFSADRTTGSDGTASFTYKYNGTARDDTVTASYGTGNSGNADTVTFHWSNGAAAVNGTSYATIADAIAAAKDGDTITAEGTFAPNSDILVDKDVTIDGGDSAVVKGQGGFLVAASGVTIEGFEITVPDNNQGVEVEGAVNNVTVTDNTLTGTGTKDSNGNYLSATGVYLNETTGTTVSNNTISKVISGVAAVSNGAVSITGNTVSDTQSEGVAVDGSNVTISGNTFKTEPTHVKLYSSQANGYLAGVLAGNTFDKAELKDANTDGDYNDSGDAIVTPAP